MGCNWSKRSSAANEPVAVGPYEELDEEHEGSHTRNPEALRKKPSTLSFIAEMDSESGQTFDHPPRSAPRRAVHPACPPPAAALGFLALLNGCRWVLASWSPAPRGARFRVSPPASAV